MGGLLDMDGCEPTKITLRDFENGQLKKLGQFFAWWKRQNKTMPAKFPMEMEPEEWAEQYNLFKAHD